MQSFVKSFETYPITVKGEPKLHIYFASPNNWVNTTSRDWLSNLKRHLSTVVSLSCSLSSVTFLCNSLVLFFSVNL